MALHLGDLLALDEIKRDVFVGPNEPTRHGRLFGGQVLAQALRAATHTVAADRLPHSCHAYFLRPGQLDVPVHLHVHRDRDGGSFSARRVVATQDDDEIFTMNASFHEHEESGRIDVPMRRTCPAPRRATWRPSSARRPAGPAAAVQRRGLAPAHPDVGPLPCSLG